MMVVIGGAGSRWGAVLGGILYTYLDNRLGALGSSSAVQDLPKVLRTPLEQPLFVLGVIFILIVFFLPGGIAGLASRGRPGGLRRLEEAIRPGGAVGGTPEAGLTEPQEGVWSLAYDVEGSGEPLLLIQGLGYGRTGWGRRWRGSRSASRS